MNDSTLSRYTERSSVVQIQMEVKLLRAFSDLIILRRRKVQIRSIICLKDQLGLKRQQQGSGALFSLYQLKLFPRLLQKTDLLRCAMLLVYRDYLARYNDVTSFVG